jgi:hypothetical protein
MKNRLTLVVPAVLAVVCWIAGLAFGDNNISAKATDAQVLAHIADHKNNVIVGGWVFMVGCICFLWFAAMVRERLANAEGGSHTFANLAFGGAIVVAAMGLGTQSNVAVAIDLPHASAATAGALNQVGTMFFLGAELSLIVVLASAAVLAFRTAVLPRWWGVLGAIVAVVLVIGPIGWAALIFGLPIWTLGTSLLAGRTPRTRTQVSPATA